jgi:predicted ester cyclase
MTSAPLKRFSEEGARAIADRDWRAYEELFSEDLAMRTPGLPGTVTGRHVRVAMVQGIMDAFPDGQAEVERAFGQGDLGCLQVRFEGTHTGPLAGSGGAEIPPTGRRVKFLYCIVVRFEDGKAVELDEYYDQLDLLTQIGVST